MSALPVYVAFVGAIDAAANADGGGGGGGGVCIGASLRVAMDKVGGGGGGGVYMGAALAAASLATGAGVNTEVGADGRGGGADTDAGAGSTDTSVGITNMDRGLKNGMTSSMQCTSALFGFNPVLRPHIFLYKIWLGANHSQPMSSS